MHTTWVHDVPIGEFRLAGSRRVLGVKLREVLMPKLHGKPLVLKLLRRRFTFFCKVLASKLREVLPPKPGETPPV
jgi:hypothetical protein